MCGGFTGRPRSLFTTRLWVLSYLARRHSCLPHSQVLMGAGLAGRPPCLPHSQSLMGAGLAAWKARVRARELKDYGK